MTRSFNDRREAGRILAEQLRGHVPGSSAADECVCALTPAPFHGVGMWYADFSQTTDDEVLELLARGETRGSPSLTSTASLAER